MDSETAALIDALLRRIERIQKQLEPAMQAAELHTILGRLGLSQVGAAELFRVNVRTVRRWMDGEQPVPFAVAALLSLIAAGRISLDDVRSALRSA